MGDITNFLAGIAIGASCIGLLVLIEMVRGCRRDIKKLQKKLSNKRHPRPTQNGIDDANAGLIELILREKSNAEYRLARLQAINQILGDVRGGPYDYKEDRSSRPKPPE